MSDLAEIVGGGTPDTNNPAYWDGDIDWYAPAEMEGQRYAVGSARKITELGLQKSSAKMLPAHRTVLFMSRAGIGKMAILQRSAATNQGFQSLVLRGGTDPYFIYSMGDKIKDMAEGVASGLPFLEISGKMLGNLEVMIPELDEQREISSFFRGIDDLITLHQRKPFLMKWRTFDADRKQKHRLVL
ncbi:restriction endonuclease subunit S [Oribacterium sp. oral taxon 102]|nr:restriction endonuclease subunit S [Oribacterium sp. oral taxon 102]